MRKVSVNELSPGMIICIDIYNSMNQLVIPKDTLLDEEIIKRMSTYSLPYLKIPVEESLELTEEGYKIVDSLEQADQSLSYYERLKCTRSFQVFKKEFLENAEEIRNCFNDVVTKHMPINSELLLERTKQLAALTKDANIFDMMHNMRQYDDSTYMHCLNVSLLCNVMANWLNFSKEDTDNLILAGMLHDIGKLMIPDSIIKKPGKLTDEEFEIVKTLPAKGFASLKNQALPDCVKFAALMHHERCDGSGYPLGLENKQIHRFARLVGIADVYDAMTSARVYRDSLSPFTVVEIFQKEGLQKYDPECILIFLERIVNTYINSRVLLSNGQEGEVVMINKDYLSRPLIQTSDGFIDLAKSEDLSIEKIL